MRKVWLLMVEDNDGLETVHSVYDSEDKAQAKRESLKKYGLYSCVHVFAMYLQ